MRGERMPMPRWRMNGPGSRRHRRWRMNGPGSRRYSREVHQFFIFRSNGMFYTPLERYFDGE